MSVEVSETPNFLGSQETATSWRINKRTLGVAGGVLAVSVVFPGCLSGTEPGSNPNLTASGTTTTLAPASHISMNRILDSHHLVTPNTTTTATSTPKATTTTTTSASRATIVTVAPSPSTTTTTTQANSSYGCAAALEYLSEPGHQAPGFTDICPAKDAHAGATCTKYNSPGSINYDPDCPPDENAILIVVPCNTVYMNEGANSKLFEPWVQYMDAGNTSAANAYNQELQIENPFDPFGQRCK